MKIRVIICAPNPVFLREKPTEKGYWGFVRSKKDYEDEKNKVIRELESLINDLRREGYDIDLLPNFEFLCYEKEYAKVYKKSKELLEADLNIILPFGFYKPVIETIISFSKNVIIFDKFEPIYSGTLFAPPLIKEYEQYGFRNIFIVEGDWEKLKKIIRVIYALSKIKKSRIVIVGPPNSEFGGMKAFKKNLEIFGFTPIFYTYDEFVELFNKLWNDKSIIKKAKKIVEEVVREAKRVVEPTEEKLLRATVYYLALKELIKENKADWVTVNCLSELIGRTQATPCLAFSLLNDEGIVATCEADPTMFTLHYLLTKIATKPSIFVDPTVNEKENVLILAHCTSPLKVLGYDKPKVPYEVRTHHESNEGATVKPEYPKGVVTIVGFNFNISRMLIVKGEVIGSPYLRICRAQVKVKVSNAHKVLENWQGFHWVYVYGDYVEELRILAKIIGVKPIVIE